MDVYVVARVVSPHDKMTCAPDDMICVVSRNTSSERSVQTTDSREREDDAVCRRRSARLTGYRSAA